MAKNVFESKYLNTANNILDRLFHIESADTLSESEKVRFECKGDTPFGMIMLSLTIIPYAVLAPLNVCSNRCKTSWIIFKYIPALIGVLFIPLDMAVAKALFYTTFWLFVVTRVIRLIAVIVVACISVRESVVQKNTSDNDIEKKWRKDLILAEQSAVIRYLEDIGEYDAFLNEMGGIRWQTICERGLTQIFDARTMSELNASYKRKLKEYHPDNNLDCSNMDDLQKKFQSVKEAYPVCKAYMEYREVALAPNKRKYQAEVKRQLVLEYNIKKCYKDSNDAPIIKWYDDILKKERKAMKNEKTSES